MKSMYFLPKKFGLLTAMAISVLLIFQATAIGEGKGKGKGPKKIPAPVPQTGQITPYSDYDDGYYQMGVAWPEPRFTDNEDGTLTDNLTGLIWLKNAYCEDTKTWYEALTFCDNLADGNCDIFDGSVPGDWRLPNVNELQSLLHYGDLAPCVILNESFSNVQCNDYWSSTSRNANNAFKVWFSTGDSVFSLKTGRHYVWCVRGGQ